jgi:hypothetical protein
MLGKVWFGLVRLSKVMFDLVWLVWFVLIWSGYVLIWLGYVWCRPDNRLLFVTIVAHVVPSLLLASFEFWSRCRDAWRRFSNFLSNVTLNSYMLNMVSFYGVARLVSRRWASVYQHRNLWQPEPLLVSFLVLFRRTPGVGFAASCRIASLG